MLGSSISVPLRNGAVAHLREPRGTDEMQITAATAPAATQLLERLWLRGAARGLNVWDVSIGERDALLAALYEHLYGDRVECRIACRHCEQPFEVAFSLGLLAGHRVGTSSTAASSGCPRRRMSSPSRTAAASTPRRRCWIVV